MRAYVIVAGVIFGLLAVVHVWRMVVEPRMAKDPWFLLVSVAAAGLAIAAWRVLQRTKRS